RRPPPARAPGPPPAEPTTRRSDLHDGGDDHGAAAVGLVDPLADGAADDLLELVRVGDAVRGGPVEGLGDQRHRVVEDGRVLGEALRRHGRAAYHLAGDRVDHDGGGDETAVAEDAALGEQGLADVADGQAVDVDVPGLDVAGQPGHAVDQVDHVAVLAEHHPGQVDAALDRQTGVGAQVAPLAVDRHEVARVEDSE